jgi:hypothetical protein
MTETELLRSLMSAAVDGDKTDAAKLVASIRVAVTQPEPPEEANCVRIMSLQKSKGLASPVTIVAGCIESFVPTIDPDETPSEQTKFLKNNGGCSMLPSRDRKSGSSSRRSRPCPRKRSTRLVPRLVVHLALVTPCPVASSPNWGQRHPSRSAG